MVRRLEPRLDADTILEAHAQVFRGGQEDLGIRLALAGQVPSSRAYSAS
jgi:hypothetical protein